MQIVRSNANARKIILKMNLAVMVKKYDITLSDARKLKNYAFLLEASTEANGYEEIN